MLAVVLTTVVLIAGLVFYAMHRSKPSRLRLSATLLKLFSISIEVESDDRRRELPRAAVLSNGGTELHDRQPERRTGGLDGGRHPAV